MALHGRLTTTGLGPVEQLVDDVELLEHVVAVLDEAFGTGVDRRRERRREKGTQHDR